MSATYFWPETLRFWFSAYFWELGTPQECNWDETIHYKFLNGPNWVKIEPNLDQIGPKLKIVRDRCEWKDDFALNYRHNDLLKITSTTTKMMVLWGCAADVQPKTTCLIDTQIRLLHPHDFMWCFKVFYRFFCVAP